MSSQEREQMLTYYIALKMECEGRGKRGTSILSVVKATYGLTGMRINALEQLGKRLEQKGVIPLGKTDKDLAVIKEKQR